MSKYAEVQSNYYDDEEERQYVDAWFSDDDNEEGVVIAKINFATGEVEYLDEDAKMDSYAQEVISEVIENGYQLTE